MLLARLREHRRGAWRTWLSPTQPMALDMIECGCQLCHRGPGMGDQEESVNMAHRTATSECVEAGQGGGAGLSCHHCPQHQADCQAPGQAQFEN